MQINECFSQGKYKMGYILDEYLDAGEDAWLICTFSAIPAANSPIKHQYSFMRVLKDVPCHKLFLQDSLGEMGTYYLCENMDFGAADTVIEIIESIRERLGIKKERVITVGSSKGGTASLYFGLRGGYGHVLCMGPQTKIATFLNRNGDTTSNHQRTLDIMIGSHDKKAAYEALDGVMFDILSRRKEETHIHLLTSHNDNQFPVHIEPFLKLLDLDDERNDITINDNIKSHSGLAEFNPDFVRSKLFGIMYGVSAEWTDDGVLLHADKRTRRGHISAYFAQSPQKRASVDEDTRLLFEGRGTYTLVLEGEGAFTYTSMPKLVGAGDFSFESLCYEIEDWDVNIIADMHLSSNDYTMTYELYHKGDMIKSVKDTHETRVKLPLYEEGEYRVKWTLTDNRDGWQADREITFIAKAKRKKKIFKVPTKEEVVEIFKQYPVEIIVKEKCIQVHVKNVGTSGEDMLFAYQLQVDKKRIRHFDYSSNVSCTFDNLESGTYSVKLFIMWDEYRASKSFHKIIVE
ncbi:MAG: hypothetical protein IKD89_07975 [Clostridia bacterium]|nr:hypothetical protein [Clostridia bacterium]